jgi:hypothetical protein
MDADPGDADPGAEPKRGESGVITPVITSVGTTLVA